MHVGTKLVVHLFIMWGRTGVQGEWERLGSVVMITLVNDTDSGF